MVDKGNMLEFFCSSSRKSTASQCDKGAEDEDGVGAGNGYKLRDSSITLPDFAYYFFCTSG